MPFTPIRGRGTARNPAGRFAKTTTTHEPDELDEFPEPASGTTLTAETIRSIITRNRSPDLSFSQSINPYRGCEHGCIYCYARPAHAYLDLSPGLDFETRILFKPDAAAVLRRTLSNPRYCCETIALGVNTDAYQPAEKQLRITRSILEVLADYHHPVAIVTKSALIERDLDFLTRLAQENLVQVVVSLTTLDDELKRCMEPRAASPARRLRLIRKLVDCKIPTGVLIAPVIPGLTDTELDRLVEAAAASGAAHATYTLLRLPHEVEGLFRDWLAQHRPLQARKVLSLLRQFRDGQLNDSSFGSRMRGAGPLAGFLARRFDAACRRHGIARGRAPALNTQAFHVPADEQHDREQSPQLTLFNDG
ncbi:MAG TPA: PA0069 family radical SAM protein [Chromatiales bacterium]|nr:PA0069 family radical SAM protein [Chromatiales bacterium]